MNQDESHDTVRPFGGGVLRRKGGVRFVKSTGDLESVDESRAHKTATDGREVADLYKALVGSDPAEPNQSERERCPICGLWVRESQIKSHVRSTAHLASLQHVKPTLNPLHIKPGSIGYRIIESQGWSPLQERGLGARDREGPREPIKAGRIKNDTIGLGVKLGKASKAAPDPAQFKSIGADESKRLYRQEQKYREAMMRYMYS